MFTFPVLKILQPRDITLWRCVNVHLSLFQCWDSNPWRQLGRKDLNHRLCLISVFTASAYRRDPILKSWLSGQNKGCSTSPRLSHLTWSWLLPSTQNWLEKRKSSNRNKTNSSAECQWGRKDNSLIIFIISCENVSKVRTLVAASRSCCGRRGSCG